MNHKIVKLTPDCRMPLLFGVPLPPLLSVITRPPSDALPSILSKPLPLQVHLALHGEQRLVLPLRLLDGHALALPFLSGLLLGGLVQPVVMSRLRDEVGRRGVLRRVGCGSAIRLRRLRRVAVGGVAVGAVASNRRAADHASAEATVSGHVDEKVHEVIRFDCVGNDLRVKVGQG